MSHKDITLINREISWLSFNERVLQEAIDKSNPLVERVRFLGIYSNNRDEFFRVRVATIKRMLGLGKLTIKELYSDPDELLYQIKAIILKQEKTFHREFDALINHELKKEGISFVDETQLSSDQVKFVLSYFKNTVRPTLVPLMITKKDKLELTDKASYLAIRLFNEEKPNKIDYALIEITAKILPRFLILPPKNGVKYIMFLDDVIRLGLKQIFKIFDYTEMSAHAIKLTLDAELDIDEDIDETITEKLTKSVTKRKKAQPVRFIHDEAIPQDLLDFLIEKLNLNDQKDIIPSGRYQNLKDFIKFPNIGGKHLVYKKQSPVRHIDLNNQKSLLEVILKKDIMLNYPFQTFSHTIDILREAAIDPHVHEIKINLYRIAKNSAIINALINASKNGKNVIVIMELHARFDEENNIYNSKKLIAEGVKVIYGVEGLKVHSKLVLIVRKFHGKKQYITHIGSCNFHEENAKLYTDISIWTANPKIGQEQEKIFEFFMHTYKRATFRELIVSPFNARRKLHELIEKEVKNSMENKPAHIILKLNNLIDTEMIKHLYRASSAGVKIQLIIRGICSLTPGIQGLSDNIEAISIVDRYLEHSRILVFGVGSERKYFVGSADWMTRNLDRRIEVSVPIYSTEIKNDIQKTLDLMLGDNQKARIINKDLKNEYRKSGGEKIRSQSEIYAYYKAKKNN